MIWVQGILSRTANDRRVHTQSCCLLVRCIEYTSSPSEDVAQCNHRAQTLHGMLRECLQDRWLCREERSSSTEGQIRFLVYTLEIASRRADTSGEMPCCKGICWALRRGICSMSCRRLTVNSAISCALHYGLLFPDFSSSPCPGIH